MMAVLGATKEKNSHKTLCPQVLFFQKSPGRGPSFTTNLRCHLPVFGHVFGHGDQLVPPSQCSTKALPATLLRDDVRSLGDPVAPSQAPKPQEANRGDILCEKSRGWLMQRSAFQEDILFRLRSTIIPASDPKNEVCISFDKSFLVQDIQDDLFASSLKFKPYLRSLWFRSRQISDLWKNLYPKVVP